MNIGNRAERAVAERLKKEGYKILDLNWRSKLAEIDIIASKNGCVYFVEVKYRSSSEFGEGFDYITRGKIKKMRLGAEIWVKHNNYSGDYELMAASVSGSDFENIELVETLAY